MKDSKYSVFERVFTLLLTNILENLAVKLADHILAVSYNDKKRFHEKYNVESEKITVIPSGVNPNSYSYINNLNYTEIKKVFGIYENAVVVVFHGSYFYSPNREAIDLIVNYIAPKINRIYDNVLFLIAGYGVPVFERSNVKSLGFVEDIQLLVHASDIAVVPILRGGGTRLKVLDYMGAGLPIVTTKKGIEGIEVSNGKHALIVDNVDREFIDAVGYLVDNETERRKIGANARKLAQEKYSWDKIGKDLNKLYRNLI